MEYLLLGHPNIPGEIVPTEKKFLKNKIFKVSFYPYSKNDLLKSVIIDESNDFKYEVKLRKNNGFRIELFSKMKGAKIFKSETNQFVPSGFKTTNKDSIEYDIKRIIWHT